MWIRFIKSGMPVLSFVHRIGLVYEPVIELDNSTSEGYSIADLSVSESIDIAGDIVTCVTDALGDKCTWSDDNKDFYSCRLGWYKNRERALEVFDEIQKAIEKGKSLYVMPEE